MESKTRFTTGEVDYAQRRQGVWRTYDATNGLSWGVLCIFQDSRGRLWLGTRAGLCRYNGAEFIFYNTGDGLAHDIVSAVCEDHQEGLGSD